MNTLRSLLFTAWLYLSMPIIAIGLSPVLLAATVALVAARFAAMQVLGSGRGKA